MTDTEIRQALIKGHTPGPWFVHDFSGIGGPIAVSCVTPDHITIADMGKGLTGEIVEQRANANLIAAAPDLLSEYDRLRKAFEIFIDQVHENALEPDKLYIYEGYARKALKGDSDEFI